MADTNYSAVDFSQLSATDDGKTVLYKDDQLCQSTSSISEIVNDKIGSKGYATETFVTGAIENLSGTVSTDYATKEELGNVGNFIITSADQETGEPIIEPSAAQTKSIYLIQDDSVTGKDQYKEWIVTENESEEKEWTCIGETSVDLDNYITTADRWGSSKVLNKNGTTVGVIFDTDFDTDFNNTHGNNTIKLIGEDASNGAIGTLSLSPSNPGGTKNMCLYHNTTAGQENWYFVPSPNDNGILQNNNGSITWNDNYYTKDETSGKQEIQDALALKEDKVFVAEYNVTPYADIKDAYDAGKQIVCKYTRAEEDQSEDVLYFTGIIFDSVPGVFVFQKLTGSRTSFQIYVGNNIPWGTVNAELQDKLTFAGENNTITAINTSAIGGQTLTAGTDLIINNGVIGVNTNGTATGNYAFAEGAITSAFGDYSHAEGGANVAAGNYSHAEGGNTRASGNYSHAEGESTRATAYYSHAEGTFTNSYGSASHAEGGWTTAVGIASHAEGSATRAAGDYSHAEGQNTFARNNVTHAEGYNTTAFDNYGHAEGYETSACYMAHSEGHQTSAVGAGSHAEGDRTIASGNYSHAAGLCTVADVDNMTVIGKYNSTKSAAFVIGNGTNENNLSDAFIVDWNGKASATKLSTSGIADIEDAILNLNTNSTNIESGDKNIQVYETDSNIIVEKTEGGSTSTITLPTDFRTFYNVDIKFTFPQNIEDYDSLELIFSTNSSSIEVSFDLKSANIGDIKDALKIKDKTTNTITITGENAYTRLKYIKATSCDTKIVKLNGLNNKIINQSDSLTSTTVNNAFILGEDNTYNNFGAIDFVLGSNNIVTGFGYVGGSTNILNGDYNNINFYGCQYNTLNTLSSTASNFSYNNIVGNRISAYNATGNNVIKYGYNYLYLSGTSNTLNISGGRTTSTIYTYSSIGNFNTVIGNINNVSGDYNILYGNISGPFYGNNNVIVGSSNYVNESYTTVKTYDNFVKGHNNYVYSASGCVILGNQNRFSQSKGTFVFGTGNNLSFSDPTAQYCKIFGNDNGVTGSEYITVFGNLNDVNQNSDNTFIAGDSNSLTSVRSSNAIGKSNNMSSCSAIKINGDTNTAKNSTATVINGFNNTAYYSISSNIEGYHNYIWSGTCVHLEGYNNSAWYRAPVAGDDAYIKYIHVGGYNNAATNLAETVIGKYNNTGETYSTVISSKPLFVIGNGTSNNARSDAFVVTENGNASATKLSTSGIQDVEAKITNLETEIGDIETILQSI